MKIGKTVNGFNQNLDTCQDVIIPVMFLESCYGKRLSCYGKYISDLAVKVISGEVGWSGFVRICEAIC